MYFDLFHKLYEYYGHSVVGQVRGYDYTQNCDVVSFDDWSPLESKERNTPHICPVYTCQIWQYNSIQVMG